MSYRINPRTKNDDPRNAMLTEAQRAFLKNDGAGYTDQNQHDYRKAIRERIHNTFLDFSLLVQELPVEQREMVFDIEHGTDERRRFNQCLSDVIQFIHTGLKGQPAFGPRLAAGVRKGEYTLGHVGSPAYADVDFEIEYVTPPNLDEVIERIKNGELNQLDPDEMSQFLRLATDVDALDVGKVEEHLNFERDLEASPPHPTWKRRTAGAGNFLTPYMPPDIYEAEEIGKMSRDELSERFPDAPYPGRAVYDGEKIYIPPWPGSDEDPTIIERFDDDD